MKPRIPFEDVVGRVEKLLGSESATVKGIAEQASVSWSDAKDALCALRRQGKASEFPAGWVQRSSHGERTILDQMSVAAELSSLKKNIADSALERYRAMRPHKHESGIYFSAAMEEACERHEEAIARLMGAKS